MALTLAQQSKQFTDLTFQRILDILLLNKTIGKVHGKGCIWLSAFISLPYKHELEMEGLNVCKYIRNLMEEVTGVSTAPSEYESTEVLDGRIYLLATRLYQLHTASITTA